MFKNAFWERSPQRSLLSDINDKTFSRRKLWTRVLHSALSVIQASARWRRPVSADDELKRTVIEGWNVLSEMNPRTRHLEIRAKSVLGVIP